MGTQFKCRPWSNDFWDQFDFYKNSELLIIFSCCCCCCMRLRFQSSTCDFIPSGSQFLTPEKDGAQVPEFPLSPGRVFFLRLMSMVLEIRVESSPITVLTGPMKRTAPALFSHCASLGYLQRSLVSGISALIALDVALARTIRTLH